MKGFIFIALAVLSLPVVIASPTGGMRWINWLDRKLSGAKEE